jgi:hypothetical protein
MRSTNVQYGPDNAYTHKYPPPPSYSSGCSVNIDIDTLNPEYPLRRTTLGSNSLKRLYGAYNPKTGIAGVNGILPNGNVVPYYPFQTMDIPPDTLYGSDTSVYNPNWERRTYGKKLYPFTHRSPREFHEYSNVILPLPAIEAWTRYPIANPDGTAGLLMQ